jgi:hypothetical protein
MRGAQAMKRPSVPPPACEAAEEDEADQGDDQAQPEAPQDRHHDADDHDDAAGRDAPDSAVSHFLLPSVGWIWFEYPFLHSRNPVPPAHDPDVLLRQRVLRQPAASRASEQSAKRACASSYSTRSATQRPSGGDNLRGGLQHSGGEQALAESLDFLYRATRPPPKPLFGSSTPRPP